MQQYRLVINAVQNTYKSIELRQLPEIGGMVVGIVVYSVSLVVLFKLTSLQQALDRMFETVAVIIGIILIALPLLIVVAIHGKPIDKKIARSIVISTGVIFVLGVGVGTWVSSERQELITEAAPSHAYNRYVCVTPIKYPFNGKSPFGLLFEFGVFNAPTNPFVGAFTLNEAVNVDQIDHWVGVPLRTNKQNTAPDYTGLIREHPNGPNTYAEKFESPNITPFQSYYIYIEGSMNMRYPVANYLNDWRLVNDIRPQNLFELYDQFDPCPIKPLTPDTQDSQP